MSSWQLQTVKARLSEVVKRAVEDGPQTITVRGEAKAVLISAEGYEALRRGQKSIVDDLLEGPKMDDETVDLINARPTDTGREIEL